MGRQNSNDASKSNGLGFDDDTDVLEAPPKAEKKVVHNTDKQFVIFRLIKENASIKGRSDVPLFKPYLRIQNTDTIVWKYKDGTTGEREIRYLAGFDTIFKDEQEKGNKLIPERVLTNPKNYFEFTDGELKLRASETQRIEFLRMTNLNVDSECSTGVKAPLFKEYSEEVKTNTLLTKQELVEKALLLANKSNEHEVKTAAKKLGIAMIDATMQKREYKTIFAEYKQSAFDTPQKFLDAHSK